MLVELGGDHGRQHLDAITQANDRGGRFIAAGLHAKDKAVQIVRGWTCSWHRLA
jgi:hypothetical protein